MSFSEDEFRNAGFDDVEFSKDRTFVALRRVRSAADLTAEPTPSPGHLPTGQAPTLMHPDTYEAGRQYYRSDREAFLRDSQKLVGYGLKAPKSPDDRLLSALVFAPDY